MNIVQKRPLNLLEGPIYPDIKKEMPKFRDSKKYWTVDSSVVKESEKYPFFVESIVEPISREKGTFEYGQSSFRSYVNEQVIYPKMTPYNSRYINDYRPIFPEGNIDSPYTKDGRLINGLSSYLTNRVKTNI